VTPADCQNTDTVPNLNVEHMALVKTGKCILIITPMTLTLYPVVL